MGKSYKNRSSKSIIKKITNTTEIALPIVDKGLQNVGSVAKGVAVKSVPVIEKGVSAVFGTMATGFDLGVKGVARGIKSVSKKMRSRRHHKKSRKSHKSHKSHKH
jgi:hypothetical protein